MSKSEVEQRRRDISAFVADHPSIGLDKPTLIAKTLGMNFNDVDNDVKFLKAKLRIDYSQYGLKGLRDKAKAHADRLKELQKDAKGIIDDPIDNAEKLKAIDTELKLIHNIYCLEQDGIGELTIEINDELADEKSKETKG